MITLHKVRFRCSATVLVALLLAPARASASPKDTAAGRAADRAMNELFAAARFDEASSALEKTLSECDGCSKHTLAQLHLDLGVVAVTGFRDAKKGSAEMGKARALDPAIALDAMVTTPEVQAAFDSAKASKAGPLEQEVVLEDESDEAPKKKKKHHHVAEDDEREPACSVDADCDAGKACRAGQCVVPPPPPRDPSVWLSFGLIQDFALVSGDDACKKSSQVSGGFTCLRASGSQYHGTPIAGSGGQASGFSPATTRVTLASDFRLWSRGSAGIRLGYAFLGQGPQPDGGKRFFAVQAEVHGAFWLSGRAFSTKTAGTFLEVAGGAAEIDGKSSVTVKENTAVRPPPNQIDNPASQTLTAYQKAGSGFAGAGAGLFLPFARGSGLLADLRVSALFPSSGVAFSLGVSGAFGP